MLQEVRTVVSHEPIPAEIAELIAAGRERVDQYFEQPAKQQVPGYVPSDFEEAYRFLESIVDHRLAPGRRFCEWGCGIGVVSLLAAKVGLLSCGIEVEPDLVETSRELARQFRLDVEFAEGTFLPPGEAEEFVPGEIAWLRFDGADAWEELAMDPREVDIVYAYPWPGEEEAIVDVFESIAADQTLLITFHGREGMRVRRQRR